MQFRVHNEPKQKREEIVNLKLEQAVNGGVGVIIVNDEGERVRQGYLLEFKKDGTIYMYRAVGEQFGFQLDSDARIKVT